MDNFLTERREIKCINKKLFNSRINLEGPHLHVGLNGRVRISPADESLDVVHGVFRVDSGLVLGSVADQPLGVRERHVGRGGPVSLVVGYDFDAVMQPDPDAAVRRAEVNADRFSYWLGHLKTALLWLSRIFFASLFFAIERFVDGKIFLRSVKENS